MSKISQTNQRASILIAVSLVFNLLRNIIFYSTEPISQETIFPYALISVLIIGFLAYQIAIGKRWARIIFLILMAFHLLSFPKTWMDSYTSSIIFNSLWIGEMLLLLFAFIFLVNVELEFRRRKN